MKPLRSLAEVTIDADQDAPKPDTVVAEAIVSGLSTPEPAKEESPVERLSRLRAELAKAEADAAKDEKDADKITRLESDNARLRSIAQSLQEHCTMLEITIRMTSSLVGPPTVQR